MFENSNLWKMKQDNSGLEYAQTSEIKQDYQELFKKIFPDLNTEPHTPAGQIITYLTETDTATINAIQDLANIFFTGGSGKFLDIWAHTMYRVKRKGAEKGSVLVDIIGVENTTIPKGFTISDGKLQFETQEEATIPRGGKLQITFLQKEVSTEIATRETLTQIITNISGVDRVSNPNSSIAGVLEESDSALYKRCLEYGSLFKNSSFESILANVANINGVKKIGGYENYTAKQVTYKGVEIPAHSIAVVVMGGDDNEIAKQLSYSKPPGCGMVGSVRVPIVINEKEIIYSFYRPTNKNLAIQVSIKTNINTPSSYEQLIKDAIFNYVDLLSIGAVITQPDIAKECANIAINFEVADVKIAFKGQGAGYSQLELKLTEMAVIDYLDISITTI